MVLSYFCNNRHSSHSCLLKSTASVHPSPVRCREGPLSDTELGFCNPKILRKFLHKLKRDFFELRYSHGNNCEDVCLLKCDTMHSGKCGFLCFYNITQCHNQANRNILNAQFLHQTICGVAKVLIWAVVLWAMTPPNPDVSKNPATSVFTAVYLSWRWKQYVPQRRWKNKSKGR
jgi:hypothetical protein